ncbi:hypothetical protein G9A89_003187, partial [Geosiphon pyriformis]
MVSNWGTVIVKEIPVDLLKSAIESVFSKFDQMILIRIQLIRLWQKALVEFESSDVASLVAFKWSVLMVVKNCHQALFYTLPVGIMAHDLSDLLKSYGFQLAAIGSILVFKGVNLHWAGLSLAVYLLGENFGACGKWVATPQDQIHLANIYKKKQVPIVHSVSFGEKTWVQVVSGSSSWVVQIPLGAASSSTSTPQTPKTPSYIDKIKQRNWGDIPITGGYSSLFQNPLFQPKFRTGFENREEESESESEKETSEKTITRPITGTSSQSRNQETRDQEEEPDIREATFRN